jgi:hypothetical protein
VVRVRGPGQEVQVTRRADVLPRVLRHRLSVSVARHLRSALARAPVRHGRPTRPNNVERAALARNHGRRREPPRPPLHVGVRRPCQTSVHPH